MKPPDLVRIQAEERITGVLSLQHDECLAWWGIDEAAMKQAGSRLGLRMERCAIRDFDVSDMRRRLPDAVSVLADMLLGGLRVYVHCTAGMGRSPLVVLGYLALVEGEAPECSMERIRAGRPEAVPAWEAFAGCREDLIRRHSSAIEQRAYALHCLNVNKDPHADWVQAEAEVLRSVLTGQSR
jgi:hypothetical protein